MRGLVGMAGPRYSWLQALHCVETASHCLVGLENKAAC